VHERFEKLLVECISTIESHIDEVPPDVAALVYKYREYKDPKPPVQLVGVSFRQVSEYATLVPREEWLSETRFMDSIQTAFMATEILQSNVLISKSSDNLPNWVTHVAFYKL
jgi:hypothetical protein